MCVGKLSCVSHWERLAVPGGPKRTIGADPDLSLLYVSKALFHLLLDCVVFFLVTDTTMQWAEALGLCFVVAGTVMILLSSHVVQILPWDW